MDISMDIVDCSTKTHKSIEQSCLDFNVSQEFEDDLPHLSNLLVKVDTEHSFCLFHCRWTHSHGGLCSNGGYPLGVDRGCWHPADKVRFFTVPDWWVTFDTTKLLAIRIIECTEISFMILDLWIKVFFFFYFLFLCVLSTPVCRGARPCRNALPLLRWLQTISMRTGIWSSVGVFWIPCWCLKKTRNRCRVPHINISYIYLLMNSVWRKEHLHSPPFVEPYTALPVAPFSARSHVFLSP